MEQVPVEVKSAKAVVGTATYNKYETVQEAVDNLHEAKVLDLINVQSKTRAMNELRASATGSVSKTSIAKRMSKIMQTCNPEEFVEIQTRLVAAEASEDYSELDSYFVELENNQAAVV